ncbi:unnamed protein product [Spirodela intermedia]|uniref:Guanine nucleotide-binding protein alpha subunit n=1 Tax=Spirodela intermedia TaxID=51605 RepID=A0A7I8JR61_SPIIN|nr:unnamed protein product [Spirodela intermedia]CAA6672687.1 unnamed protein product [Spirodela intermedia]
MGCLCSKQKPVRTSDAEENAKAAEIEKRIAQEATAEKHIQKVLLLGAGESGKSTIFKQIRLLFQTGFDEAELRSYIPVIHANVFQTIKILYDGAKEFAQNETDSLKYVVSLENKETLSRGNLIQVPDCAQYFMKSLRRVSDANYVPTKEDVLYARIRTTGVAEIQFRRASFLFQPRGREQEERGVYKLFDAGGQRNERRKWIHLFEGYDQALFEDETKNRMMETKALFDWVLKQPCFEKTSFMLFLNKFDIFEEKALKVPLSVCEWFKDYQPVSSGKQEVEHAYEFVKKKFEELYFQSSGPERVDRVFKIYRTTALDQKLIKKTIKLVDETLRRRNLLEAGLL